MKKLLLVPLVLLIILSGLFGCSAKMESATRDKASSEYGNQAADSATQGESAPSPSDRRVIRNASLDMVAEDVADTYNSLLGFAEEQGGYETDRNQRTNNGFLYIDAQIRIKPDKLDAFIAFAKELSGEDNINVRISTQDITDSYFDSQTRLNTMEKSLEQYYGYLEKAKTIEESLLVQEHINRLTLEIESLKGTLSLWDKQLAESTVDLSIRQSEDPVKMRKEINWTTLSLSDTGYLMTAGLKSIVNIVLSVLQWLLIALVATAPLWIVALIVILIIRNNKKRKNR